MRGLLLVSLLSSHTASLTNCPLAGPLVAPPAALPCSLLNGCPALAPPAPPPPTPLPPALPRAQASQPAALCCSTPGCGSRRAWTARGPVPRPPAPAALPSGGPLWNPLRRTARRAAPPGYQANPLPSSPQPRNPPSRALGAVLSRRELIGALSTTGVITLGLGYLGDDRPRLTGARVHPPHRQGALVTRSVSAMRAHVLACAMPPPTHALLCQRSRRHRQCAARPRSCPGAQLTPLAAAHAGTRAKPGARHELMHAL